MLLFVLPLAHLWRTADLLDSMWEWQLNIYALSYGLNGSLLSNALLAPSGQLTFAVV